MSVVRSEEVGEAAQLGVRTYAVHVAEEEGGEAEEDNGPALGELPLLLLPGLGVLQQQLLYRVQQLHAAALPLFGIRVQRLIPVPARWRGVRLDVCPAERSPPDSNANSFVREEPWPGSLGRRAAVDEAAVRRRAAAPALGGEGEREQAEHGAWEEACARTWPLACVLDRLGADAS